MTAKFWSLPRYGYDGLDMSWLGSICSYLPYVHHNTPLCLLRWRTSMKRLLDAQDQQNNLSRRRSRHKACSNIRKSHSFLLWADKRHKAFGSCLSLNSK